MTALRFKQSIENNSLLIVNVLVQWPMCCRNVIVRKVHRQSPLQTYIFLMMINVILQGKNIFVPFQAFDQTRTLKWSKVRASWNRQKKVKIINNKRTRFVIIKNVEQILRLHKWSLASVKSFVSFICSYLLVTIGIFFKSLIYSILP